MPHRNDLADFSCVYQTLDQPCDVCYSKGFPCGRDDKVWGERRRSIEASNNQEPVSTTEALGPAVPRPPLIPADLECSANDAVAMTQLIQRAVDDNPGEWIYVKRAVLPYFDNQARSQLVHHTLLATAHLESIMFQWRANLSERRSFIPIPEFEQHLTEFALEKVPGAHLSLVHHLGHAYRLAREALQREDYFDALLGTFLLARVSLGLCRCESFDHARALELCAGKVFQSKGDSSGGVLKKAVRCFIEDTVFLGMHGWGSGTTGDGVVELDKEKGVRIHSHNCRSRH
jgi:hypothetical protein